MFFGVAEMSRTFVIGQKVVSNMPKKDRLVMVSLPRSRVIPTGPTYVLVTEICFTLKMAKKSLC